MSQEIRELTLADLSISPQNVRKEPGDLDGLTESINALGVLEPILVWWNGEKYEVIAGSRRVAAASRAGHTTIPAIVVAATDVQAKLISLIENLQREKLSLGERVEAYRALQDLNPAYSSYHELARATGQSHQKITQDFQASEMLLKLEPHGIMVASDLPPTDARRQRGEVLPEYHAVLLKQAMPYVVGDEAATVAETEEKMVLLARKLALLSQATAKAYIEAVKDGREPLVDPVSQHVEGEPPPSWHFKSVRHGASRRGNAVTKQGMDGGLVTCSCCEQPFTLIHLSNGAHQVKTYAIPLVNQQELPGLNI